DITLSRLEHEFESRSGRQRLLASTYVTLHQLSPSISIHAGFQNSNRLVKPTLLSSDAPLFPHVLGISSGIRFLVFLFGISESEARKGIDEERLRNSNSVFDGKTGEIFLNGDHVSRENLDRVLAHELVHAAKRSAKFCPLISQLEKSVEDPMEAA
ncbi:hypothetical protein, partial [uncultured Parasutterella sp.]|uniref:hypothetical protein n=3 Tax=uncultured Parasutterella sp. TaxID=1263098 RepID=UPI0026213539